MVKNYLLRRNGTDYRLKYSKFGTILLMACLFGTFGQMTAQSISVFGESQESVGYDFDECRSFSNDNSNYDYSEFTPTILNFCAAISGGQIYRESGKHSCTDDEHGNAGRAACFQSSLENTYSPDHTLAIRFDVELSGSNGKKARLDGISFKQLAPHNYLWTASSVSGSNTGPNNYPTKFGIRVIKDGQEVFRNEEVPTSQVWSTSSFDFIGNTSFMVDAGTTSTFTFELFSYEPIGNGAEVSAWDLDDLKVFSSCEIDCEISVDAGDDIEVCTEEKIELTATSTGNATCVTGCVYPVLDVLKCHGGDVDSEELYLFSDNGSVIDRKFNATAQHFETFENGTARYTATATNGLDVIEVDMLYSGHTTEAPANSPKEHSCGYNQDVSGFEYYTTLNGTIVSQNHGTFYATSMGPSFQIGVGADVTRDGFGASGWFNLTGGDGHYTKGDVNIPLADCETQEDNDVSFQWTTEDGTIVGNANQKTIEVSSSGSYVVTVTGCDGCNATDEVVVDILGKVSIGDFVWEDTNRNGMQDHDENGVDGVNVALHDCTGTFLENTVTKNGGFYSFDVCPGEYYVVFSDIPNGYEFTDANAADDTLDSDAGPDGTTLCVNVATNNDYTLDAGIMKSCVLEPSVEGTDIICKGEEAILTASGGNSYLWSTGETTASITVTPEVTTDYTVTISDSTVQDCSETVDFIVKVESVSIQASADIAISHGDSTTLTVTGADASDQILWSTGETTESIEVSPESTTTYSVIVSNQFGCMAEDSVTVSVGNGCGINPGFKILPRDNPGIYTPGAETAACIGDDYYLWMYIDEDNLSQPYAEDFTDWKFIFEFPNGTVIVQDSEPQYPGNNRTHKLNLTAEDFGEYKISWVSPKGCEGSTVMILNFPDVACGTNGTRTSQSNKVASVYPLPAKSGNSLTVEVNTINKSIDTGFRGVEVQNTKLVSNKETVWVQVYNIGGQQLGQSIPFEVEKGKVKIDYDLKNLPSGNYILKVVGNGWSDSKQIIIE